MDIIDVVDDFNKFLKLHEDCSEILQDENLYDEIFKKTSNEQIKKFLLENKLISIGDEKIKFVYLNHHTDKPTFVKEVKNIDINTIVEGKTLLENTINCYLNRLGENDFETKQLDYIIYLLESGANPNLEIFVNYINLIGDNNIHSVLTLVELMYLYGAIKPRNRKIDDETYEKTYNLFFSRKFDKINKKTKEYLDDWKIRHNVIDKKEVSEVSEVSNVSEVSEVSEVVGEKDIRKEVSKVSDVSDVSQTQEEQTSKKLDKNDINNKFMNMNGNLYFIYYDNIAQRRYLFNESHLDKLKDNNINPLSPNNVIPVDILDKIRVKL